MYAYILYILYINLYIPPNKNLIVTLNCNQMVSYKPWMYNLNIFLLWSRFITTSVCAKSKNELSSNHRFKWYGVT